MRRNPVSSLSVCTMLLPVFALGLSCRSSNPHGSRTEEVGGQPSSFSCGTIYAELDRYIPKLEDATALYVAGCDPNSFWQNPRPSTTDPYNPFMDPSLPRPESGVGASPFRLAASAERLAGEVSATESAPAIDPAARVNLPPDKITSAEDPNTPLNSLKGLPRQCKDLKLYGIRIQAYVDSLEANRLAKRCDDTDRETITVINHPTCGTGRGCDDRLSRAENLSCHTCEYTDPVTNLLDPRGTITCQTERGARDAVELWCENRGFRCAKEKIQCRQAPPATTTRGGVSGTLESDVISASSLIQFDAYLLSTLGGLGTDVNGRINTQVMVEGRFSIQMLNDTEEATWVKRADRVEARTGTSYKCSFTVNAASAIQGISNAQLGFKVLDTGIGAGLTVTNEARLTGSRLIASRDLNASGLTKSQILDHCKDWSRANLKSALETGTELVAMKLNPGDGPTTYRNVYDQNVWCTYGSRKTPFRINRTWITERDLSIVFQYELDGWLNWNSPKVEIPKTALEPYLEDLYTSRLSGKRLASLTHEVAKKYMPAPWKTASCTTK